MQFAARIKAARKAADISQERAAKAVGTSRRHWIRWENGETTPNPAYLNRIADVLGDDSLRPPDEDEEEVSSMPMHREDDFLEALRPLARLLAKERE